MNSLISVQEAQERILRFFDTLPIETIALENALGLVLAEDIHAPFDLPPFTSSSMDGFALRSEDIRTASPENPVTLRVIQDIPAGTFPNIPVLPGEAARIMTGAPIPMGVDCVVPAENTNAFNLKGTGLPDTVQIVSPVAPGQYLRPKGQDLQTGDVVLRTGTQITPQDIGLLASMGKTEVRVYPRPQVILFSSGNEIVPPGSPLEPGKIYDSNLPMLTAMLKANGAVVVPLGTLRDDPQEILKSLERATQQKPAFILTSAGVSVGTYDFVRKVVEENGSLDFWRVNMRPGKPLAFGFFRDVPFIGLPGNPVSSFVGFTVFVIPVLRKLMGFPPSPPPTFTAILEEDVESDGRESYLRGNVIFTPTGYRAHLEGHQGSGNLASLSKANALLILPSGVKSLPAGTEVKFWFIR